MINIKGCGHANWFDAPVLKMNKKNMKLKSICMVLCLQSLILFCFSCGDNRFKKAENELSDKIKDYLDCDYDANYFEYLGFKGDRLKAVADCKNLYKRLLMQSHNECLNEFERSRIPRDSYNYYVDLCLINWLDKQLIYMNYDWELFNIKHN